jgi:hypothetical protein
MKIFKFVFIFFIITSCSDKVPIPISLDIENWNSITETTIDNKIKPIAEKHYKLYAKSSSYAIINRRELIANKLDSLFNIGKSGNIKAIERYHSGVVPFYTVYLKVNNSEDIFLIKAHGDTPISVEVYNDLANRFSPEKDEICANATYPNNVYFQKINSYTEFSISNSKTKVIKACFSFENIEIN